MKNLKQTHTPGPWDADVVKHQGEGAERRVFIGAEMQGGIGELYADYEGWEANARLIAAAPELLGAGKDALTELEREAKNLGSHAIIVAVHNLKEAIAKAEGRS